MTYDQFEHFKRQQAEFQQREERRFWDNILREQRRQSMPPVQVDPGQAAAGTIGLLVLLTRVLQPVAKLLCLHDLAPPWRAWRKKTALVGAIGFGAGILWQLTDLFGMGGLGDVLCWLCFLVVFFAALPRTLLILTALFAALGIYVEFFLESGA